MEVTLCNPNKRHCFVTAISCLLLPLKHVQVEALEEGKSVVESTLI